MSFDGDADRQIYYYGDDNGKLQVVDGDKQFTLIMMYIIKLLKELKIEEQMTHILVQTAYCNQKGLLYLAKNDVEYQLVKTGVKHAHPVVVKYDIGANDEPNGHGTVTYNMDRVNEVLADNDSLAARKLKALLQISNKFVGDSVANMLVMEAILYDLDMSI